MAQAHFHALTWGPSCTWVWLDRRVQPGPQARRNAGLGSLQIDMHCLAAALEGFEFFGTVGDEALDDKRRVVPGPIELDHMKAGFKPVAGNPNALGVVRSGARPAGGRDA